MCDLRDELVTFLSSLQSTKAHDFLSFLTDTKVIADVNVLCDIMSHLNHLNLQLEGKNHTVAEMYEAVEAAPFGERHSWEEVALPTSA